MKRFGLVLAVAIAALVMTAASANASFVLTLDDLATPGIDVIVIDDAAALSVSAGGSVSTIVDGFTGSGVVNFSGTVGSFTVNITTAISKPVIGAPGAMLDLNSVNVTGGGPGTLVISTTDTDYDYTQFTGNLQLESRIGGTAGGTVDFVTSIDEGNVEFGATDSLTFGTWGPGVFSCTGAVDVGTITADFSLTQIATITHAGAAVTSFDAESEIVPEPASVLIWSLLGLVGLVVYRRRK